MTIMMMKGDDDHHDDDDDKGDDNEDDDMAASQFIRSGTGSGTHMRSRPPFQTSVPDLA